MASFHLPHGLRGAGPQACGPTPWSARREPGDAGPGAGGGSGEPPHRPPNGRLSLPLLASARGRLTLTQEF